MEKQLGVFRGECLIGVCGTETTLVDYNDETLKIGDIVIVKLCDKEYRTYNDFMTVVCNRDYINIKGKIEKYKKATPTDSYILGLRDISITRKGLAYKNEEGEFQAGWIVSKLKGCEDCIEGEYWKDFDISYKDISDLEILPESLIGWDNVSI